MATAWTSNKFNWACLFHDIPCVAGMPEIEIYAHRTSTISARWLRISWAEKRVTFLQVPSWIARIFVSQHKMFSARARLGWSYFKKKPWGSDSFELRRFIQSLHNDFKGFNWPKINHWASSHSPWPVPGDYMAIFEAAHNGGEGAQPLKERCQGADWLGFCL